jgi:peptide/nickel transport system ATP-binding protein
MHDGQVVETGTTDDVYDNPRHPYTQRLVAAVPTLAKALAGVSAADLAGAMRSGKDEP